MTGTETFRAFYAVPFSPATAEALEVAARERLAAPDLADRGGWRPIPAGRIHLTLKFLGEAPVAATARLEEVLRAATAGVSAFSVALGGWVLLGGSSSWPSRRDPRVLAVGVSDPVGTFLRLAASLEEGAASLGFARETRPFLPHVTVARRKPGRGRERRVVPPPASGMADGLLVEDTVGRVVLMRSTLGKDGPSYAVVAEAGLGR